MDDRPLCRDHFYQMATKRLVEHRERLQQTSPEGTERIAISRFLTELISQTTTLVATAKFLGPWQRDQYLELSLSAAELYKRVQRNPRIARNMPVLIYREDSNTRKELTNTINVSRDGACVATSGSWATGEQMWIEKPRNQLRAHARVAWVKKHELFQFLMGLEILDCEDFWGLEPKVRPRA